MIIAIDCSMIRSDGAVAIQDNLIEEIIGFDSNITMIYLFCNNEFNPRVNRTDVKVIRVNFSNRFSHLLWYLFVLNKLLQKFRCGKLYLLGGYYLGGFRPINTIVQNLLPLDIKIVKTYPLVIQSKLLLLNWFYKYTFKRAEQRF